MCSLGQLKCVYIGKLGKLERICFQRLVSGFYQCFYGLLRPSKKIVPIQTTPLKQLSQRVLGTGHSLGHGSVFALGVVTVNKAPDVESALAQQFLVRLVFLYLIGIDGGTQ